MSTSGALNPETETRPVLTQSETDRARQYGRVRQVQLGEILYRPGQVGCHASFSYRPAWKLSSQQSRASGLSSTYIPECLRARRA